MANAKYVSNIDKLNCISEEEKTLLRRVTDRYIFRSNDYYLGLIDWSDPHDPIRRLIFPSLEELEPWGYLDPSDEGKYTILPGLQHKYRSTALLLASKVCGGICRYCFRKRLFLSRQSDILRDFQAALEYIKSHPEITNVLLTGGDPLMLSTPKLEHYIEGLFSVPHVRTVRIGTKLLSFNPFRVLDDPSLPEMISRFTRSDRKVYVVAHFTHPREFTSQAARAVEMLQSAGAILINQCPLIRGVNDRPETLAELFQTMAFAGIPPYYVFQCRPAVGNKPYSVPIEEGYEIFEAAKARVSGLAKRARYVMSHHSGKIEVVGKTREFMFFKYHRAAREEDSGRFFIMRRNHRAYWLDDYDQIVDDYILDMMLAKGTELNSVAIY
ncbi:MAG: KamA family radical SAM protein [Deltaproteobacteria bacterium]|nr:KamA family radical SAM protein [Deltaproteobacteria bacterium]MBW2082958.1 KamA family radical SAM protein [Deltaproteobacteria bacterium]